MRGLEGLLTLFLFIIWTSLRMRLFSSHRSRETILQCISLKYSGMDVSYFLAFFLSEMKKKDNASYSHISKFYDAIKYGSKVAGHHLSLDFYSKTDTFLICFKKEFAQAKKQGNTDEQEADAVSSTLLSLLVLWAVEEGNIFVWVFLFVHVATYGLFMQCGLSFIPQHHVWYF